VSESDKAQRYIASLNTARLNAAWSDVPELVRKVDKHAPHRTCLTLAAASEAQTATSSNRRPGTQTSAASHTSLLDLTPKLVHAIETERTLLEDAFQANVALHEIYFLRAEWSTVLGGLETNVWSEVAPFAPSPTNVNPNTRLAIIKYCYFLGVATEQKISPESALAVYSQAISAIDQAPVNLAGHSEYRTWTARLLGRISTLQSKQGHTSTLSSANAALVSYRAWARTWTGDSSSRNAAPSYSLGPYDVSNKEVWAMYYNFLSFVLSTDLIYTSSAESPLTLYDSNYPTSSLAQARLRQRSELKQVEAAYESVLLHKTKFPQANQSNEEVEQWANSVISNWSVLNGPRWREIDLGEGGKAAVSRSTLDILYRAATKTFHSTLILRHLFTLHASLAEFDLAIKAFDSYTEIISRAKSRAEKTGHNEPGLDSDDLVVLTAAQAIGVLCRYGSQAEGEKALEVSKRLSDWLKQPRPNSTIIVPRKDENGRQPDKTAMHDETATGRLVSAGASVAAYRAIGESQANFARITHDPAQRSEYREKAIKSLKIAAEMSPDGDLDPETALLLGTVLAENRQLLPATQIVKFALASSQDQDSSNVVQKGQMIPLYHLMSLLLTARGDYEHAVEFCDVAFEQFGGVDIMLGDSEGESLIMQMEDSEKEGLLQLRLTQLALTEMLDGSETAVDAGSQVLALYHKLFATPSNSVASPPKDTGSSFIAPSLKTEGTFKSVSGSIMRRSKSTRKNGDGTALDKDVPPVPTMNNNASAPLPTTNDENISQEKHHHKLHIPHHPLKHLHHHEHTNDPEKKALAFDAAPVVPAKDGPGQDQLSREVGSTDRAAPVEFSNQSQPQDLRLPAPYPTTAFAAPRPRYSLARQRQHTVSLLIEIWLHIAGQYTRGEFFEDAEGAVEEAHKLAEQHQHAVAREDSSAKAFDEKGWGGSRSANRLWADVWAEVWIVLFRIIDITILTLNSAPL
jgi:tetratricopeptide (TPR) repeat protein